jgi:hypothetical protein
MVRRKAIGAVGLVAAALGAMAAGVLPFAWKDIAV